MVLIAGLGNPGSRYAGTRHNVGFMVVDLLAARTRAAFRPGQGPWMEASIQLDDRPVLLLKPTTFMNVSGSAVAEALARPASDVDRLLVVFDDFQLPLGRIRLRERGTDGGHNGLASVIEALGTLEIPRLRCGIASNHMPAEKDRMAEFVLETFEPDEIDAVQTMVVRAADACETAVRQGWTAAMNEFNRTSTGELDNGSTV